MRRICTILFLSMFANLASAQHFNCATQQKMNEVYENNPAALQQHIDLIRNSAKKVKGTKAAVVTIPVVFHIIHEFGSENISDAQIFNQMEILNRDFRKMNADTALVIEQFDSIIGDAFIEFKLAAIDPEGNCTNGIDRIYSHQTNAGDNDSKLNQWPPNKYLNIWTTRSIGEAGVAGYAYYPSAVDQSPFARFDGIIILSNYIGSIGSSNNTNSRALTHEIGHYLNLAHVWGNTNDPGVACGDDGLDDTPITKGYDFCPADTNAAKICDPNIVENYQNYMDYSYCSYMFTEDQAAMMYSIINGTTGSRNNLISPENAAATGIDQLTVPTCEPIADFSANTRFVCQGTNVNFTDETRNAVVTSRNWTFQDGSIATSTSANPVVSFNSPGYKKITLTVTNAAGTSVKEDVSYIYVSAPWVEYVGPRSNNLETNDKYYVLVDNPENNDVKFVLDNNDGYNKSTGFRLQNYRNTQGAALYSDDYFYYPTLGNTKDALITPSYNLSNTSNVTFSYKYAYATNASVLEDITEEIRVYRSSNCGLTWTIMPTATVTGGEIVTGGFAGGVDFAPANNTQWKTKTVAINAAQLTSNMRFKIEFTASDFSNNLFIDEINIEGVLGIEENVFDAMEISVYPNPVSNGDLKIDFIPGNDQVELILRDLQGHIISSKTVASGNTKVTETIGSTSGLAAAYYMLEIKKGNASTMKKVVVL